MSAITYAAPTPFTHRPNTDGTTASFCNRCFVTVAVARGEIELERAERIHVCDPSVLEYWKLLSDSSRFRKSDSE